MISWNRIMTRLRIPKRKRRRPPVASIALLSLLVAGCVAQQKPEPAATKLSNRRVVVENDLAPGTPRARLAAPAPAPPVVPKKARVAPQPVIIAAPPVRAITLLRGKVLSANTDLHFAVVDFTSSHFPAVGQRLGIFRNNAKVGEIRMSGPFQNGNAVGDLIDGEAMVGDDVRALDQ